jgi:hypothetical protein
MHSAMVPHCRGSSSQRSCRAELRKRSAVAVSSEMSSEKRVMHVLMMVFSPIQSVRTSSSSSKTLESLLLLLLLLVLLLLLMLCTVVVPHAVWYWRSVTAAATAELLSLHALHCCYCC